LRYFGFDDVRLLDGGLRSWLRAGYPVSSAPPPLVEPSLFVARPRPELLATKDDVIAVVGGRTARLVNALSPRAFRGDGPGAYSRPGRIPGSVNAPAHDLVDAAGCFRARDELVDTLAGVLDAGTKAPLIAYCGAGISATVDIFALSLVGCDDARLYDGSLTEWSADPQLSLEVG
jgi:thiosulfate/3-mercaptopyruvate sulfurtransferase